MYSPEEIEKKRLMAHQRRAQMHEAKTQNFVQSASNNGLGVKRKLESSASFVRQSKHPKQVNTIKPDNFFAKAVRIKAACRMITANRFEIDVPYHQQLIEFFKTIPSRAYEQKTKLWNFDIDDYSKVVNGIKSQFSEHINVTGIPQVVLRTFRNSLEKKSTPEGIDLSRIDPVLVSKLMPFQREGIEFAIQKGGRCMIADEMGLGKTIQALGVAHYFQDSWPLLIVTPSSIRYQWSEAICEFLPSVPYLHIFHYSSKKDYIGNEKITIVSYDLLARNIDSFEKKTFGCVIFDESHTLKNQKTERTKAALKVVATARHILLLTGTPALSRPIELYTQISLINRNFMKIQDYGIRYCEGKKGSFGWDFQGASNTTELQLLLKCSHLIRRLKSDVLKQLPDKIRQIVMLDPDLIKTSTKEMKEMAANLKGKMLEGFEKNAELMRYYSESSQQRLAAVGAYVKDLIEKKEKFIIFAHHQCVLDKISEVLDKNRVKYIRIDGKTHSDARKHKIDYFQESEDCLVAVLSIIAANCGITLTAASFVVFAELYWNPAQLTQAEGRAHRIGQQNCVIIQYLIAKGTVDDIIWPLLQNKANFLQKAGLDQNFSLSEADLLQQPSDQCSTEEKTQGTLESYGFSQKISASQEDEFATPMETFSLREKGKENCHTDNSNNLDDFAKLLDDDAEDFENLDLDNIN